MILTKDFRIPLPKAIYYIVFTISGFSGLIYESIWSHYLKLFLGHAAYAQSLVLAIFMGGMAAGAWIAANLSAKWRTPILIYAIAELIIGVLALVFHTSFVSITDSVYTSILPSLDSNLIAHSAKWTIAALMIIPQSILLGMTFPLMTAGIIRRYPSDSGKSISTLYFTNSIGAAIGVLASGFFFIKTLGLPGTILTAGIINILLAVFVWVLIKLDEQPNTQPLKAAKTGGISQSNKLLLTAAFITGMASFIYEISWIRMLSLVLGSSTHAFELMLSAFIAGLAFGGLWIRKRIDHIASPIKFSAYVQIIMGICALLTIPLYTMTFDWMSQIMSALNRNDDGYTGLLLSSHAIVLIIMLPTTFCAGTTLPLFTHTLLKTGYGEKSIGRIYAFNTIGSIIGVIFAVNIGLPILGLKNLIGFGAALDIALGIALLIFVIGTQNWSSKIKIAIPTVTSLLILVVLISTTSFDPRQLAVGTYRNSLSSLSASNEFYFYKDGKTSSIAVYGDKEDMLVIATNGKPDASIQFSKNDTSDDEPTMILAAALPFGYHSDAKTVANIGLGSGQTTHTLLALQQIEHVDTIEIESAMVEGSKHFGAKVERAHKDPRSRIHIEDAKTFFSINNSQYDIIISEPSNPWVSGTSSLFTDEFYSQVKNYLNQDGVLVQWIHIYESNIDLLTTVLKAIHNNFTDFAIYNSTTTDLIIIAKKSGKLSDFSAEAILESEFQHALATVNITKPADLYYRLVANQQYLKNYLDSSGIPINSDYFPYLDQNAHRAFFVRGRIKDFTKEVTAVPVFEILNRQHFEKAEKDISLQTYIEFSKDHYTAQKDLTALLDPNPTNLSKLNFSMQNLIAALPDISLHCEQKDYWKLFINNLNFYLPFLISNGNTQSVLSLWETNVFKNCYKKGGDEVKTWMDFYKAVALSDSNSMAQLGEKLINSEEKLNLDTQLYLLTATILGNNIAGHYNKSIDLWEQKGSAFWISETTPFPITVLISDAKRLAQR